MAAVGKSIAAVCEDNTVNVYDAVTGVLRLSLNAPRQVTKAEGSSDGSILFCAHQSWRKITLWDMQTGGLIDTLTTKFEVCDIAVSPRGKYLASCSSDGGFECWEVGNRYRGSHLLGKPIVSICWLKSEDRVALAFGDTIVVLDMTTRKELQKFPVGEGVRGVAFSAKQRRLAVWLTSRTGSRIVVIDARTGSTLVSSPPLTHISCFTFSDNGDRVVCASEAGDLQFFRINAYLASWCNYPSHLGAIHSICRLQGDHLVVGVKDCIQLLVTKSVQLSYTGLEPEVAQVYPLDNGKAICASSGDRGIVRLLDMENLGTLIKYGVAAGDIDLSSTPRALCASIDRRITILNFTNYGRLTPMPQVIRSIFPDWENHSLQSVLLVALSPGGGELVAAIEGGGRGWEFQVLGVSDGRTLFHAAQAGPPPGRIVFTSETKFYTEHEDEDCHEETPHTRVPQGSRTRAVPVSTSGSHSDRRTTRSIRKTFILDPRRPDGMIRKLSEERVLSTHPYGLDRNLEWVVDAKSRRVCWLPPGTVTGTEDGHFFIGSSIVMAGKDGIVRRLTFREPRSDS